MLISVVMCTRNRAAQLGRVLESAANIKIPPGLRWEMILVDNGSTDNTASVVDSYRDRLPIRRVEEGKAGLSNARNKGVAEAVGEYICWTDDDVLIDPDWLSAYAAAFERHPDAAIFGGVVAPEFEQEPPLWFVEHAELVAGLTAKRDLGERERELPGEVATMPYGANFALRAEEQRRYLYDPLLGVGPNQKRLGEETAVLASILKAGGRAIWVPGARVRHLIPSSRTTLQYLGVYYRSIGSTWAYLSAPHHTQLMGRPSAQSGGWRLAGVPTWVLRNAARFGIQSVAMRVLGRPDWLAAYCEYSHYRGAAEYWHATRG